MENGNFPNCLLLGDSGHLLRRYFLTPLENTRTRTEQYYNESHIRTRNVVERLFGNWKRRFPVLAYGLRLKLQTVLTVIVATAVLQNIARRMDGDNIPEFPEDMKLQELEELIENGQDQHGPVENDEILDIRNDLINNYFANLFMQVQNGFPGIIGAIDCTHIGISSPPVDDLNYPAIVFLNRKGYYSLNVQISMFVIQGLYMIRQFGQLAKLEHMHLNGNTNSWLIGDSGYPLEPWLMTYKLSTFNCSRGKLQ
ncbi:hypothetical protein PPYR_01832 [Photinus pyralis]|uniref:DDE Tnp4 domain-containing protein n=1 Tax=Photinus pyralis TaxID=7054 RepID=A0A5N4B5I1_PHOPY|nr:hypothetical protein PPYR_01832 [Photinus pyralis]